MLSFITENLGTIIVCAVLIIVLAAVIAHLIQNKKKGKSSCGCGCAGCAMKDSCHSNTATPSSKN